MTSYNGIPISEGRLLTHSIIFTALTVIFAVVLIIWMTMSLSMKNKKDRQHLRNLKRRAKKDDIAKKQLDKIKRKNRRKRYENKARVIFEIISWILLFALAAALLAGCVIPAWWDYIQKDYAVYTGKVKVVDSMRQSHIELEDGTTVWGSGDLEADDGSGTVVYAVRSKRLLGAIEE